VEFIIKRAERPERIFKRVENVIHKKEHQASEILNKCIYGLSKSKNRKKLILQQFHYLKLVKMG